MNLAYNLLAGSVTIRGDTDFTHPAPLDRWDEAGRFFILGMAAQPKVVPLAGNLKRWHGLLTPDRARGLALVRMEFRRFLQAILLIPCQVVRPARRVSYRGLGYNGWLKAFLATWARLQRLVVVE